VRVGCRVPLGAVGSGKRVADFDAPGLELVTDSPRLAADAITAHKQRTDDELAITNRQLDLPGRTFQRGLKRLDVEQAADRHLYAIEADDEVCPHLAVTYALAWLAGLPGHGRDGELIHVWDDYARIVLGNAGHIAHSFRSQGARQVA